ncbi:MAG: YihY/virulence factor BrkB family protein, partial [Lachnospiraceae bacterium]|nr:YihY/virulence factor BrkB family protein [Lachnospiraceae bacterium]
METTNKNTWKDTLLSFLKELKDLGLSTHASSIAFFFFLSLIPLLIIAVSVIPLTGLQEAELVTALTNITPDVADSLVQQLIDDAYNTSAGLVPVFFIVVIWTAARGTVAIIRGLNAVYGTTGERKAWIARLFSFLYTILMIAAIVFLLFFRVFERQIAMVLDQHLPESAILDFLRTQWHSFTVFLIAVAIFASIYTILPDKKQRFFLQIPGAAIASVAWLLFSFFFSLYTEGFNIYSTLYGSLATLAILLFWLYCCMYILLFGSYVNHYLEMHGYPFFRKKRADKADATS